MKRIFPLMYDEPEKGMHFALLAYWLFAFELIPTFIPMIAEGLWDDLQVASWLEIIYHCLNSAVIVIMLKSYLADSFLNVQLDTKKFFLIVGISSAVLLAMAGEMHFLFGRVMVNFYPLNEKFMALTSGYLVEQKPLFGTLCHTLFTPFAIVGLFYVAVFAPVCRHSRWLGYLAVTVFMAVPCILDILWRGNQDYTLLTFLLQLPVHWVACWTYQKTDTVWAPVATIAIFNLGTSLLAFL